MSLSNSETSAAGSICWAVRQAFGSGAREGKKASTQWLSFHFFLWKIVQPSILLYQDLPRFSESSSFLLLGSLSVMSSSNLTQTSLSPKWILFVCVIKTKQTSERKKKSLTWSPGVDDFRTSDTFIKNHSLPVSALGFPMCCAVFRLAILVLVRCSQPLLAHTLLI